MLLHKIHKHIDPILFAAGGGCWILGSLLLSLRPGGIPPFSYRHSNDLMPLLGIGFVLFALGIYRGARKTEGMLSRSGQVMLVGSIVYLAGSIVRLIRPSGLWEPLMPLGFLGFASGLLLCIYVFTRRQFAPPLFIQLLVLCAISLLCFNDQFRPQCGLVFGALLVCIGLQVQRLDQKDIHLSPSI